MFFFFNDTATTEIYTLSLHDALPISGPGQRQGARLGLGQGERQRRSDRPRPPDRRDRRADRRDPAPRLAAAWPQARAGDRKSTRLNSSHANISYAVFCLKKKKKTIKLEILGNREEKERRRGKSE